MAEPLNTWGMWLELFYKDPNKYAMGFQLTKLHALMCLEVNKHNKVLFTERSLQDSFRIFSKILHKNSAANFTLY